MLIGQYEGEDTPPLDDILLEAATNGMSPGNRRPLRTHVAAVDRDLDLEMSHFAAPTYVAYNIWDGLATSLPFH